MSKPKVIVICGSTKFVDIMAVTAWLIEKDEQAISLSLHYMPKWYDKDLPKDHLAEHEGVAKQMDELHMRKIDLADEIFVVDYDFYVGSSTRNEINYALKKKINVRYFMGDKVGLKVLGIMRKAFEDNGPNHKQDYIRLEKETKKNIKDVS